MIEAGMTVIFASLRPLLLAEEEAAMNKMLSSNHSNMDAVVSWSDSWPERRLKNMIISWSLGRGLNPRPYGADDLPFRLRGGCSPVSGTSTRLSHRGTNQTQPELST